MRILMIRSTALLVGAALLSAGPVLAQTAERPTRAGAMPAPVRAAASFLYAAYPELVGRALEIHIRPENGEWLVSLAEVVGAAPTDRAVLVRARFAFDAQVQLQRFSADGPHLSDGRNAVLRDAVRTHPGWIESDADVELMRLGGASVVAGAFAPVAPATKADLARHLGSGVTTSPPTFTLREAKAGQPAVATAAWRVDATATDAGGKAVQYRLTYEPVGGKLVGVERVGGAQ